MFPNSAEPERWINNKPISRATTSCKSTWDTVPYFGINGLFMILCLWPPLHPLSKLLAIQDHTQNLEEQLWMGERREVSIIFHRPVTRSDLRWERSFFCGSVSSFLQLVVALAPRWLEPFEEKNEMALRSSLYNFHQGENTRANLTKAIAVATLLS